jgi:hypothetical protein
MKIFNYKRCKKQLEESSNYHLGNLEYGKLKKEWYELAIKIIESNIKEKPCQKIKI